MAKGIKRSVRRAIEHVSKDIHAYAHGSGSDGFFAGRLASEGWLGGYRQALYDVSMMLDGNDPCDSRTSEYWTPSAPTQKSSGR